MAEVWTSSCCNPLELPNHSWTSKKNLRLVTKWMCEKATKILMGSKICDSCRKKLTKISAPISDFDDNQESDVSESNDEAEEDAYVDEPLSAINSCLSEIGETPIRKKKLHQAKYPEQKVEKITAAMKKGMLCDEQTVDQDGDEMIQKLIQKFLTTNSRSEKLQILTVLPKSWPLAKVEREFGVSKYTAMKAKDLVREKGILATPDSKPGHTLAPKTAELVLAFYNSDEVSRIMPGKKDFVSVKENGHRFQVRKD